MSDGAPPNADEGEVQVRQAVLRDHQAPQPLAALPRAFNRRIVRLAEVRPPVIPNDAVRQVLVSPWLIQGRFADALRAIIPLRLRPIGYLNHLTFTRTQGRVRAGPFVGMRYVETAVGSGLIPKLLGQYEHELSLKVELICNKHPRLVVDLGAAEGYYAVGLALRIPGARVVAFEMQEVGQEALVLMAQLNGVEDRLAVRGKCEPEDLALALGEETDPIVICDVEGYEEKLMDPVAIAGLRRATIMVEVHDFIKPDITDALLRRFELTHQVEVIWQDLERRIEFPWSTVVTRALPASYLEWLVSEWRPVRMHWLWMVPNSTNSDAAT